MAETAGQLPRSGKQIVIGCVFECGNRQSPLIASDRWKSCRPTGHILTQHLTSFGPTTKTDRMNVELIDPKSPLAWLQPFTQHSLTHLYTTTRSTHIRKYRSKQTHTSRCVQTGTQTLAGDLASTRQSRWRQPLHLSLKPLHAKITAKGSDPRLMTLLVLSREATQRLASGQ